MPFIDEEELKSLKSQVQSSVAEKKVVEGKYFELSHKLKNQKKTASISIIVFGVLIGIASGIAVFMSLNNSAVNKTNGDFEIEDESSEIYDQVDDEDEGGEDEYVSESSSSGEEQQKATPLDKSQKTIESSMREGLKGKTVYSIQIKALKDNEHPVLSKAIAGLVTNDDYFKYTVGLFDSLEEAQRFRKELVAIGFSDAFIASYVNGDRQKIEHP